MSVSSEHGLRSMDHGLNFKPFCICCPKLAHYSQHFIIQKISRIQKTQTVNPETKTSFRVFHLSSHRLDFAFPVCESQRTSNVKWFGSGLGGSWGVTTRFSTPLLTPDSKGNQKNLMETCVLCNSVLSCYWFSIQFQLSQLPTQHLPDLGNAGAGAGTGAGTNSGEGGNPLVLGLELGLELSLLVLSPPLGAESELDVVEDVDLDFGAIAIAVTPTGWMVVINTKQYLQFTLAHNYMKKIFCFSLLVVELNYVYLSSMVEIASLRIYHLETKGKRHGKLSGSKIENTWSPDQCCLSIHTHIIILKSRYDLGQREDSGSKVIVKPTLPWNGSCLCQYGTTQKAKSNKSSNWVMSLTCPWIKKSHCARWCSPICTGSIFSF